jgi:hypothetical protein
MRTRVPLATRRGHWFSHPVHGYIGLPQLTSTLTETPKEAPPCPHIWGIRAAAALTAAGVPSMHPLLRLFARLRALLVRALGLSADGAIRVGLQLWSTFCWRTLEPAPRAILPPQAPRGMLFCASHYPGTYSLHNAELGQSTSSIQSSSTHGSCRICPHRANSAS